VYGDLKTVRRMEGKKSVLTTKCVAVLLSRPFRSDK